MKHSEEEYKGYKIQINYDEGPHESPRDEYDNLATMVCFHKRYTLGDKHKYDYSNYNSWNELEDDIIKNENIVVILPLYMYDHSGITISTSPFSCRFDSGQIGFIFISKEKAQKEFNCKYITKKIKDKCYERIASEVKTYDHYLGGEFYYFVILDKNNDAIDSCGGFDDSEYCLSYAKEEIDGYRLDNTKQQSFNFMEKE